MKTYHSSNNNFRKFSLKNASQPLFWFTDNKQALIDNEVGARGRRIIYECEITITNPCGWAEYKKLGVGQIRELGHDGIILPSASYTNYICFNPNQIQILNKINNNHLNN